MAINFFEQQEEARRQTRRLVFWFVLAVLVVAAAMYVVVLLACKLAVLLLLSKKSSGMSLNDDSLVDFLVGWWYPWLFAGVLLLTLLIILWGSWAKMRELKDGGGHGLARSLGGVLVADTGQDPLLRRLINLVDEMAIAAGVVPPPPVYVLVEAEGINALAAGFAPETAVVVVTRGAVEKLDRDELQGMIAHEFSHIVNGDMPLNLRLLGMVSGIEMLAIHGKSMMEMAGEDEDDGWGWCTRRSGRLRLFFFLSGGAVYLLGSVGHWMAQWIKAAVSRQRESLADAAAVQFTRNPEGLVRALRKIRGLSAAETWQPAAATAASHMFFTASESTILEIMGSHPAAEIRIGRVLPGSETKAIYPETLMTLERKWLEKALNSLPRRQRPLRANTVPMRPSPAKLVKQLSGTGAASGNPAAANWTVKKLQEQLPEPLRLALQDPTTARAAVLGLIGGEPPPCLEGLEPRLRLLTLEVALPALQRLGREEQDALRTEVHGLAEADAEITLFEYAVLRMLDRAIRDAASLAEADNVLYYSLLEVRPACETLLSMAGWVGASGDEEEAERIFSLGISRMGSSTIGINGILPAADCSLAAVDQALETLGHTPGPMKQKLVDACLVCIAADCHIGETEAELVRAVAAALGCRQPLVLAGDHV